MSGGRAEPSPTLRLLASNQPIEGPNYHRHDPFTTTVKIHLLQDAPYSDHSLVYLGGVLFPGNKILTRNCKISQKRFLVGYLVPTLGVYFCTEDHSKKTACCITRCSLLGPWFRVITRKNQDHKKPKKKRKKKDTKILVAVAYLN